MSEADYAKAPVLLFDPVHVNQRTTRYALFEIGFRTIECVSNVEDFKTSMKETSPTLVVAETSGTDTDMFKLVRSIRRSDLGRNPFVVILLTTWSRDTNHIRKAIECGADDVIVRPFSTMFAHERVRTLIQDRKEFIVTSDYVGPDRRKNNDRNSDVQPLAVPNFLAATVTGDTAALERGNSWVREAKEAVLAERLRRMVMRIVISVEIQRTKPTDGGPPIKLDVADMAKTARELRAQLVRAARAEAAEVTEALIDQIEALGDGVNATDRSLQLIKELATTAYAAYANGESVERSKDEIERTVASLRARLQGRAGGPGAGGTADTAGQSGSPGIKRAAM